MSAKRYRITIAEGMGNLEEATDDEKAVYEYEIDGDIVRVKGTELAHQLCEKELNLAALVGYGICFVFDWTYFDNSSYWEEIT